MRSVIFFIILWSIVLLSAQSHAQRSKLYPQGWKPGETYVRGVAGLQDYSYAGYKNSEREPSLEGLAVFPVPHKAGTQDYSPLIQNALDRAASSSGVVQLQAGEYPLLSPIKVRGNNVVLRGAGMGLTKLWFVDGGATTAENRANIWVGPETELKHETNKRWEIQIKAQAGDDFVKVKSTAGLKEGDTISIAWDITPEFRKEHNSDEFWFHVKPNEQKIFFRRIISKLDVDTVYFKVPLRYAVKLRDKPAVLKATGYASELAVEALSFSNTVGLETAWNSYDQSTALLMTQCVNCWLKEIGSFAKSHAPFEVRSHGIRVQESFQVTVSDSDLKTPEHLGGGGNGYLYQLSRTNEVLIKNSKGVNGRHNFSINWDFGSSGNVFHKIYSAGGLTCRSLEVMLENNCNLGPVDFHHALAIANLFDQVEIHDALQVANRQKWSSGAGQTGTENVFWNIQGGGEIFLYNQGMGYLVGTGKEIKTHFEIGESNWAQKYFSKDTEPQDYIEHLGRAQRLVPQSLFQDQLNKRLAKD